MSDAPVIVDSYAGGGGFWLRAIGADLVPPVSWMGGKRRLATELLTLLGLRPGSGLPILIADASWWGWVWSVVLDPVTGPEVSALLRFWRARDPRALWFWLREIGPLPHPVEAAAQLLWLQARASSGVPVWWDAGASVMDTGWKSPTCSSRVHGRAKQGHAVEPELVAMDGHGRGPYRAFQATGLPAGAALVQWSEDGTTRRANGKGGHGGAGRLFQWASSKAGHEGASGAGGIVDTSTVATRLDAIHARLVKGSGGLAGFGQDAGYRAGRGWRAFETSDVADRLEALRPRSLGSVTVAHALAADVAARWAPELGERGRVYLDPPYQGATGYPVVSSRVEVLGIAETWARHGARVVLSEAVPLAADLGVGWRSVRLRGGKKPEWVTCHGCDTDAIVPWLVRAPKLHAEAVADG